MQDLFCSFFSNYGFSNFFISFNFNNWLKRYRFFMLDFHLIPRPYVTKKILLIWKGATPHIVSYTNSNLYHETWSNSCLNGYKEWGEFWIWIFKVGDSYDLYHTLKNHISMHQIKLLCGGGGWLGLNGVWGFSCVPIFDIEMPCVLVSNYFL